MTCDQLKIHENSFLLQNPENLQQYSPPFKRDRFNQQLNSQKSISNQPYVLCLKGLEE